MTRAMKATLIAIALFFMFTAGTFLWFVATWDPEQEEPVGRAPGAVLVAGAHRA